MNQDENGEELEKEFEEEISYPKEEEAASDDELLIRMKKRILRSYRWYEDVIKPFSEEFKISTEELEDILMKRLDMSSLEALQPRFESSKLRCTKERIHSDLKICWLCDVMNILTDDEAEDIKNKIAFKVLILKESYGDALEEGKKDLLVHLKR